MRTYIYKWEGGKKEFRIRNGSISSLDNWIGFSRVLEIDFALPRAQKDILKNKVLFGKSQWKQLCNKNYVPVDLMLSMEGHYPSQTPTE